MHTGNPWQTLPPEATPSTLQLDKIFFRFLPPAGARILDCGCGCGSAVLSLRTMGHAAYGCDINTSLMRNRASARSFFLTADGTQLPFKSAVFDRCIMQAFLTTLCMPASRALVLREAGRVLVEGGLLYLGVFALTEQNPSYRERYRRDAERTGEYGTFIVTADGTPHSAPLYTAHHYSEQEIRSLLAADFTIRHFSRSNFTSFHRNKANGFIILAEKPGGETD